MTSVECHHYSSFGYASGIAPWIKCSYCDDFHCTIHHEHVANCDCPRIDVWLDYSLDPYSPLEKHELQRVEIMLKQNPPEDEGAFDPSEEHF